MLGARRGIDEIREIWHGSADSWRLFFLWVSEVVLDSLTRSIIGYSALLTIQVLLGTTIIYLVRKWKDAQPAWSWIRALGGFLLLALLVTAISLIPTVGRFVAMIASLVGLQRLSKLDLLSTFILSFCVGVSIFVMTVILSNLLDVDLLGLKE